MKTIFLKVLLIVCISVTFVGKSIANSDYPPKFLGAQTVKAKPIGPYEGGDLYGFMIQSDSGEQIILTPENNSDLLSHYLDVWLDIEYLITAEYFQPAGDYIEFYKLNKINGQDYYSFFSGSHSNEAEQVNNMGEQTKTEENQEEDEGFSLIKIILAILGGIGTIIYLSFKENFFEEIIHMLDSSSSRKSKDK